MKLTRHNGRSGKHGTYNPRHNDRRFDVENSEHIDAERARQNVYWDCYRGFTTHEFRENPEQPDFSFEEIERMYYYEHYGGHVEAQNARNEKTRHTERNRTVEDLLKNNKTCPEESIYQIGTMGESVPPDTLFSIVNEFYEEFERRFGSHIHILDWALHLDEGTPHIHERHVFDCENRYGELCPQQEKALEELGIPLPNPEKPKGRNNNRKQTFDAVCRTILFDIARRHGLHLDQEPSYGGRDYLEKQDYILMNEKKWFLMEHEEYGTRAAYVILSEEGTVVMNDCYNGFDEEARRNIQNFMQQQAEQAQQKQQEMQAQAQTGQTQSGETQKKKPELANWQKVMDNGEYLRSAEMAEEANYNMIDGLMNNTPKKKDKNAPRRSVLKRLRNHQKKIASQGKGQPQQQKAMEEEMERKKK